MAPLAENVSQSMGLLRRKLLQIMDAVAESGMRQAHREIARVHDVPPLPDPHRDDRRKPSSDDSMAVH
jgi:hypothetical protein